MNLRESGDLRSQGEYTCSSCVYSKTSNSNYGPMPEFFPPVSLVAIYLGIKKRPSPGPSDVAGI